MLSRQLSWSPAKRLLIYAFISHFVSKKDPKWHTSRKIHKWAKVQRRNKTKTEQGHIKLVLESLAGLKEAIGHEPKGQEPFGFCPLAYIHGHVPLVTPKLYKIPETERGKAIICGQVIWLAKGSTSYPLSLPSCLGQTSLHLAKACHRVQHKPSCWDFDLDGRSPSHICGCSHNSPLVMQHLCMGTFFATVQVVFLLCPLLPGHALMIQVYRRVVISLPRCLC